MALTIEKLPIPPLMIGEAPHWDIDSQSLYLVDLVGSALIRYDLAQDKSYVAKLDIPTATFIIPVAGIKGTFVVGCELILYHVKWDGISTKVDSVDVLYKISADPKANKINDAKCDSAGQLWFGTLSQIPTAPTGKIYSYSKDKGCREHVSNIGISNGLCWAIEGNCMYYIDSLAKSVDVFDCDSNGSIGNRRVLFDFQENNITSFPDGMTIDKDGNLWVACFAGSQVLNIKAKSGKLINEITLPTCQITSVAWGGPNLDELYVTSGNYHSPGADEMFMKGIGCPNAGCTFRVTGIKTCGLPMEKFKL